MKKVMLANLNEKTSTKERGVLRKKGLYCSVLLLSNLAPEKELGLFEKVGDKSNTIYNII